MKFNSVYLKDVCVGKGEYGIGASAVPYSKKLNTYLRITDINDDGTLNTKGLVSLNDVNADKYLLKKNDICFARTGNSTGKTYCYDGSINKLTYAGFLIMFRPDSNKINPRFLKYYTLTTDYKNWVKEIQTGSTRGNINANMYGNMPLQLPNRNYQDRIVKLLDILSSKIAENNHTNDNLLLIA